LPTRWDVKDAVFKSELTATQRLVMFVLIFHADTDTAVIPPDKSPSQRQLARESGLARSAVLRALDALAAAGWVGMIKPSRVQQMREHAQTSYLLEIPVGMGAGPSGGPGLVLHEDHPLDLDKDRGGPPGGPGLVLHEDTFFSSLFTSSGSSGASARAPATDDVPADACPVCEQHGPPDLRPCIDPDTGDERSRPHSLRSRPRLDRRTG
jgi:hypothetical protein